MYTYVYIHIYIHVDTHILIVGWFPMIISTISIPAAPPGLRIFRRLAVRQGHGAAGCLGPGDGGHAPTIGMSFRDGDGDGMIISSFLPSEWSVFLGRIHHFEH